MLDFLRDPDVLEGWQQLGGAATLLSYGLRPPATVSATAAEALRSGLVAALPDWHLRFLNLLAPSFACGDFFFTHAGVRPGVPLEEQKPEDLMWIRQEFLQSRLDFGKVVVHGHTPVRAPEIHDHRVNIDTGAYATGRLTVLRIDGHDLRFLVSERRR